MSFKEKVYKFRESDNLNDYLRSYILNKSENIIKEWKRVGPFKNGPGLNPEIFDWCGLQPRQCMIKLDPFRWEDEIVSKYIRKNVYDIVTENFPEVDKNSMVIGWTNILKRDNTEKPDWHSHDYGDKIGNQFVISGNYYVDAETTSTELVVNGDFDNTVKIPGDDGTCVIFDGRVYHRVSDWKTWKGRDIYPRITFSFDIIPQVFIDPYFTTKYHHIVVGTHNMRRYISKTTYAYLYGSKSTGIGIYDIQNIKDEKRPLMLWELNEG